MIIRASHAERRMSMTSFGSRLHERVERGEVSIVVVFLVLSLLCTVTLGVLEISRQLKEEPAKEREIKELRAEIAQMKQEKMKQESLEVSRLRGEVASIRAKLGAIESDPVLLEVAELRELAKSTAAKQREAGSPIKSYLEVQRGLLVREAMLKETTAYYSQLELVSKRSKARMRELSKSLEVIRAATANIRLAEKAAIKQSFRIRGR
jgi:Na+-transporting NADH:ubiquinone oxidoreductase subunit NqrC